MSRPPIALMLYNRPEHTRKTLEALSNNYGADETDLFVFSDGPKNEDDIRNVQLVRKIAEDYLKDFKSVEIISKQKNAGLAESIISGVSTVVNQYGQVIVVEDDLILASSTLDYFKQCLDRYRTDESVYSISAYSPSPSKFSISDEYPYDIYSIPRMMCWGWATWSDRWSRADWQMSDFKEFLSSEEKLREYRSVIGNDSLETLKRCVGGTKDVWACRWVYTHFINDAMCICPRNSYVQNIGLDGSGTNCGKSHDKENLQIEYPDEVNFPESVRLNSDIFNQFMNVYNNTLITPSFDKNSKKKSIKKRIKRLFKKFSAINFISQLFNKLYTNVSGEIICLGTEYGGWRVISRLISDGDGVLSAGVGEDMSFDFAVANIFGADVMLMDPTPRALNHYKRTCELIQQGKNAPINNSDVNYKYNKDTLDHLSYMEYGLWKEDTKLKFYVPKQETHVSHSIGNLHNTDTYFEADCKTLKSLYDEGQLNVCSILKLDIEGAEFAVVRDLVFLKKFRPKQLLIEFHPGNSNFEKKYRLKTLLHSFMLWMIGYRIVSIHGWDYQFVYSKALR